MNVQAPSCPIRDRAVVTVGPPNASVPPAGLDNSTATEPVSLLRGAMTNWYVPDCGRPVTSQSASVLRKLEAATVVPCGETTVMSEREVNEAPCRANPIASP